jgi:hypothetical protein
MARGNHRAGGQVHLLALIFTAILGRRRRAHTGHQLAGLDGLLFRLVGIARKTCPDEQRHSSGLRALRYEIERHAPPCMRASSRIWSSVSLRLSSSQIGQNQYPAAYRPSHVCGSGQGVGHSDTGPKRPSRTSSTAESHPTPLRQQNHAREGGPSGCGTRANFHLYAGSRRVLGGGEFVLRLQVHPHLSGCSKIAGQS